MQRGNAWRNPEQKCNSKKRNREEDTSKQSEKTLDSLLHNAQQKIQMYKKDILPKMKMEHDALVNELENTPDVRMFFRKKKQIAANIQQLKKSIESIESGEKIKELEKTVQPYIDAHQKNIILKKDNVSPILKTTNKRKLSSIVPQEKKINRRKSTKHTRRIRVSLENNTDERSATILDELADELKDTNYVPPVYVCTNNTCRVCGEVMRKIPSESCLACENCGSSVSYLDSTTASAGHDDRSYPQFSYKKLNHFTQWIKSTQGKEICTIDDSILEAVCQKLFELRVEPDQVNPKKIRECLKACKLRKYYENCVLITSMLTNKDPPRFTPRVEQKLETMFLRIQTPFEKAVAEVAPTRKNFLSYAYVCFKFCQLIPDFTPEERKQWLESFSLLKGRDKLHRQDQIWKHICNQLSWKYIPSV